MKRKTWRVLPGMLVLFFASILGLTSCQAVPEESIQMLSQTETYVVESDGEQAIKETDPAPLVEEMVSEPTNDELNEPVIEATLAEESPAPKTGLEASNPSKVSLTSGGIQFVEFFAYW